MIKDYMIISFCMGAVISRLFALKQYLFMAFALIAYVLYLAKGM